LLEVQRDGAEGRPADDRNAVARHEVAEHLRVLPRDRGADIGQHPGRQTELCRERVHVPRPRAAARADQDLVGGLDLHELLDERMDRRPAAVHEALATDLQHADIGQIA